MKKTKEEILSKHLHDVENGVYSHQDKVCDVVEEIKAAMEEYATQCQQDNAEKEYFTKEEVVEIYMSAYGDGQNNKFAAKEQFLNNLKNTII